MNDQTPDPMTVLGEAAAGLHEIFLSMTGQGFTENQACLILGAMLAAGSGNAASGDQP